MTTTTQALVYINEPVLEFVDDPLTNFKPNANESIGGEGTLIAPDPNELMGGGTETETPDQQEPVTDKPSSKKGAIDLNLDNDDNLNLSDRWIRLEGGKGNDKLTGNGSVVEMYGGSGNDKLDGTGYLVEMYGGSGNDTLIGNGKAVVIQGGLDDDMVIGGSGRDFLMGGEDDDFVIGGGGNDWLVGGTGFDQITGGEGEDNFDLTKGDGHDKIRDFTDGEDSILIQWKIIDEDLLITNVGRDAHVYYDNDLLAVVMGAAGMLDIQDDDSPFATLV